VSPESKLHAGHLAKQFCELTGLRGGGSAALAQIGGAEKEKMAHYKEVIGKLLRDG
jgi:alanyl-tRNA synthetase